MSIYYEVGTFLMEFSLSRGRWQVAFKREVTWSSFNFLVYLCPATIWQSYNIKQVQWTKLSLGKNILYIFYI